MKRFSAEEWLFSVRCYLAGMAALYISMSIGLTRPFWALTTAYIVSQPWSGAVRSKAVFRLIGTFVGSAMTVWVVPRFANEPVVMTLIMVAWIGVCLYISVLDRTPRSYLFMLAGYTAAMIGFPSVLEPSTVFDTALARVEEIAIGIICATVVHSIVWPHGIAPLVMAKLDRAVQDASAWITDTLSRRDSDTSRRDRRTLANDITQLRILSTHVPYDTSNIRWTAGAVRAMQDQMSALTPVISAIDDRLAALAAAGPAPSPACARVLAAIEQWVAQGGHAAPGRAAELRGQIAALAPAQDEKLNWHGILMTSLATRLRELVDGYDACLQLRRDIEAGLAGKASKQPRPRRDAVLHRDHGMAALSAVAVAVVIGAGCLFWIQTGWSAGATAVLWAAIFSCFFASQDDPVPGIVQFLIFTLWSIPLSALYLLVIMPALHSFESLALCMLPVCLVLGGLIARPSAGLQAMAMFFGFSGTLALHDTQTADLVSFLDSTLAQVIGVAAAAIVAALLRRISVDTSARRIQAASWRELAALAGAGHAPVQYAFNARMLDRIGLLQLRLGLARTKDDRLAETALADLRVGNDIIDLQRVRGDLALANARIVAVLVELRRFFRSRARGRAAEKSPAFLTRIDRALGSVGAEIGNPTARTHAIVALVGIRRALFPEAPPFQSIGPGPEAAQS
jgi:uncharacterized membrane protein YccC